MPEATSSPLASKSPWEKVLDALDPKRPIRLQLKCEGQEVNGVWEEIPGKSPAVVVERIWNKNTETPLAEWFKQYRKNADYGDLSAFNEAESRFVQYSLRGHSCCYQYLKHGGEASVLARTRDAKGGSSAFLRTTHVGASVKQWLDFPVRIRGRRYDHLFQLPENFLRLALAGLESMKAIHALQVVHADFNEANYCLSGSLIDGGERSQRLSYRIDWSELKLIDFGYSIARNEPPVALLPLRGNDDVEECQDTPLRIGSALVRRPRTTPIPLDRLNVTPKFDKLLCMVSAKGEEAFKALTEAQRNAGGWQKFTDAQYSIPFWLAHGGGALSDFCALDWREDYWRFGKFLKQLRDGRNQPGALRGLVQALEESSDKPLSDYPRQVRELIERLPEAFLRYGAAEETTKPAPEPPYRELKRHIEAALDDLGGRRRAGDDEVLILRSDVEPDYTPFNWRRAIAGIAVIGGSDWRRVIAGIAVIGSSALLLKFIHDMWPPSTTSVVVPPPVAAGDPAAACWRNGSWAAACGFEAYPGGPTLRVVGGNLRFTMGSPENEAGRYKEEGPPHPVTFAKRFAIAETETTVAQYLACVQEKACDEPQWRQANAPAYYRERDAHLPDRPITGVSWHNAGQYVAWLSRKSGVTYVMPSEAMWEYAARGGSTARWSFGDDESRLSEHAWFMQNSGGKLYAVGTKRGNEHPWGLKDLHGNAGEWVADCWHDNYNAAPENGGVWEKANGGDCGRRVWRGGSWSNLAGGTRAASRIGDTTVSRSSSVGFRPTRMLP